MSGRAGDDVSEGSVRRRKWEGPWRLMGPWWVRPYRPRFIRWHPCTYFDGRFEMHPIVHELHGPPSYEKVYVKELADA